MSGQNLACGRFNFHLIDYVGTCRQHLGQVTVSASAHVSVSVHIEQPHLIRERDAAYFFATEVLRIPDWRIGPYNGSEYPIAPAE